jgi:prepilin-type N-terminal cleavage/methylation domain-containing protein
MTTENVRIRKMRGESGFTLVELLVILAIIALILGIVTSNLAGISGGARSRAASGELHIIQSAFDTMMIEVGAITISECLIPGGVSVGPSTVITCYRHDGTPISLPTDRCHLRLHTTSTGKYTWDNEGLVIQASY